MRVYLVLILQFFSNLFDLFESSRSNCYARALSSKRFGNRFTNSPTATSD